LTMRAMAEKDCVVVIMTVAEYHLIMGSLRELAVEMHELDFLARVGVPRNAVADLAQSFFDESLRIGIEE
jgi:hypothetical protein